MDNDTSKQEILDAIHTFSDAVDEQFKSVDKRLTKIESEMVTKEYLDDKLTDLRGDLTVIIRKEDTKLAALVKILRGREVISEEDRQQIFAMEPFPSLSL